MQNEPINVSSGILKVLGPSACDHARRDQLEANLLANPNSLNGIDFVEFQQPNLLKVHFLGALPAGSDPYQLTTTNLPTIRIEGGVRITGITPKSATPDQTDNHVLKIIVSEQGDFSTYWLSMGWTQTSDGSWAYNLTGIDRQFSVARINFRPGCPVGFDCAAAAPQAPPAPQPVIDYLAKDYSSFRQLLLDYVAQHNPGWTERNPADLGITLLELLAYEGDYLSYFQDAVANEAFLDTARKRISAKRHARLVDYTMHDGRNAWTSVHFRIASTSQPQNGVLPQGWQVLTKVETALRHQAAPPVTQIDYAALDFDSDPALAQVKVFETAASMRFDVVFNELRVHAWGNRQACLPAGTTVCHLYAVQSNNTTLAPGLLPGDLLLLEEVKGLLTGAKADANPNHRQVVTITRAATITDELYDQNLDASGHLQLKQGTNALQLTEVAWAPADALTFPVNLSTVLTNGTVVWGLSVARGNMALADHGRTVGETINPPIPETPVLSRRQVTMLSQPDLTSGFDAERTNLTLDVRAVTPAVKVTITDDAQATTESHPAADLLESNEFDSRFVVDVDDDGRAQLRFGDDVYGRSLSGAVKLDAKYRVGNGAAGNVGAEAIAHVVNPPSPSTPGPRPVFELVRNPLSARDGVDPETIEQVRQYAPAAFHSQFYRAVTEADYVAAALTLDGVADAVAEFRWTGSWYTALIGISPMDSSALVLDSRGLTVLDATFARTVEDGLRRFKLAGYDLEIRAAKYVSLDVELHLCVNPDHFRADVIQAVLRALSNGVEPDGRLDFFNPANFRFGQPVYLSRLYAAIQAVEGVDAADVRVFQRYGQLAQGELESGVIKMGPWEIARLDNNANLKENGVLLIDADGGK